MSGLEIFGAVAAAVTLLELAKSCSNLLRRHENAHRDIAALHARVDVLAGIVAQVSEVLHDIRLQDGGKTQITDAEFIIWQRMTSVLGLCQHKMAVLNKRLGQVLSRGPGQRLSTVPADIARLSQDLRTYIKALDMLKGLFQLVFQRQQNAMQLAMHQDMIEIGDLQRDKLDTILRGIGQIKDQFHSEQIHPKQSRTDSFLSGDTLRDDDTDSLSMHLNKIVIAATDVRASFAEPQSISQISLPPSSAASIIDGALNDFSPDITHVEPLQDLAQRFKLQAIYDLEHEKYQDAEVHQLESIECFKELHDAHKISFDTYHEMMMKLAQIYKKLRKYDEARRVLQSAAKQPLAYDRKLGWKCLSHDASEDTEHRAHVSHEMAELFFDRFASSSESSRSFTSESGNDRTLLQDAERYAKRAFRIRRGLHDRDHQHCVESARLLYNIYINYPDKRMYAETYNDIYHVDDDHRNELLTFQTGQTSRTRSLVPSEYSNLTDAVKDHHVTVKDIGMIMSNATSTELEHIMDGKSVVMVAMDCIDCNKCNRCFTIFDKLLRLGADRDAPFAYAAKQHRIADCKSLLRHGANIDWLDPNGLTPLMFAIKQGNVEMTAFLLDRDADVNIRSSKGQTALHIAVQERNEDILKLLLKVKGLEIDARDDNGLTALHHCAKQDNVNFTKRLARAGASLEMKDKSGRERTPLWIAVKEDKYLLVKALLKLGAHVDMDALPPPKTRDIRNLLQSQRGEGTG